jgi:hypothetical protein
MMAVFSEFINEIVEVSMNDFSVYGKTFMDCLANLDKVLTRCAEVDLVLNWEKCHFMVKQGIVLGHVISERGIEVDKAKVETVEQLQPPTDVKSLRSFGSHTCRVILVRSVHMYLSCVIARVPLVLPKIPCSTQNQTHRSEVPLFERQC